LLPRRLVDPHVGRAWRLADLFQQQTVEFVALLLIIAADHSSVYTDSAHEEALSCVGAISKIGVTPRHLYSHYINVREKRFAAAPQAGMSL
jgi:hypothetical protein